MDRGRFIAYEGVDGAGTTTQAQALVEALEGLGRRAHYTREPSDLPVGTHIRRILRRELEPGASEAALAALFAADRLDHLDREIRPALAGGVTVVCDRYVMSSLAYQGVMTGDAEWVAALNREAPPPDLTVLLDISAPEGARRRAQRDGEDTERYDVDATQTAVATAYRDLAQAAGALILDGTRPRAELTQAVLEALERLP
jgi:dTMP kinase